MQYCNVKCNYCAQKFWRDMKHRNANMSRVMEGNSISFVEAAVTSVKPLPPNLQGQYAGYIQLSHSARLKNKNWRVWWVTPVKEQ